LRKKFEKQLKELEKYNELLQKIGPTFDVLTKGGVAYFGAKTFNHPAGALIGLVALELAKSMNLVAGASGVATLGAMGLCQVIRHTNLEPFQDPLTIPKWWIEQWLPKLPE